MAFNFGEATTEYLRDNLGSNELAVDGRVSRGGPVDFVHTIPTGWVFYVDKITFTIVDNGALNADRFGARGALSIGIDLELIHNGTIRSMLSGLNDSLTLTRNADFAKLVGRNVREFGNRRGLVADWLWEAGQVRFEPGAVILARVNENISNLISFTIALKGRLIDITEEEP